MFPIPIEGLLDKLITALAPGAVHAEQMGAYPMVEENQTADAATDARQLAQLLRAGFRIRIDLMWIRIQHFFQLWIQYLKT